MLDVTLRDGGCVLSFNFGIEYMKKILFYLEKSKVDSIELGYLDETNGSLWGRTTFATFDSIKENYDLQKKSGITYLAMIDYGKFSLHSIPDYDGNSVDGFRVAFHKENLEEALSFASNLMSKGYKVFLQPMLTMRYSDFELLNLISYINSHLFDIAALYVVDTFGEMREENLLHYLYLFDDNLSDGIPIGFHSHNNLQLSYSNAIVFLRFLSKRDKYIDSSIMGMGKGAGNLNTELFLDYLNLYHDLDYEISALLTVIDEVILVIYSKFSWGYSPTYYLSSVNRCSPSYASYFSKKYSLCIEKTSRLLSSIEEGKKNSFDEEYADNLYYQSNLKKVLNDPDTTLLKGKFQNKSIMLIAPGKSLLMYNNIIEEYINRNDIISISLNHHYFNTDFYIYTRQDKFELEKNKNISNIICTTNVVVDDNYTGLSLNYKDFCIFDNSGVHDSSGIIALNLMVSLEVKHILFAGFDGFRYDIDENYYTDSLKRYQSKKYLLEHKKYYQRYIKKMKDNDILVDFITPSLYQNGDE